MAKLASEVLQDSDEEHEVAVAGVHRGAGWQNEILDRELRPGKLGDYWDDTGMVVYRTLRKLLSVASPLATTQVVNALLRATAGHTASEVMSTPSISALLPVRAAVVRLLLK